MEHGLCLAADVVDHADPRPREPDRRPHHCTGMGGDEWQ